MRGVQLQVRLRWWQFNYHGPDLLGSIAKVEVRRDEPVVMSVGGGLWFTDNNVVPDDANLQFAAGQCTHVKSQDGWVYAGGKFSRGKNGYVCLNNIARIRHSDAESGSWEDLGGGCDERVNDMQFWGDDLYVAGDFVNCGGKQVNFIAAYNNGQFRSLNNGLDDKATRWSTSKAGSSSRRFEHAGGLPRVEWQHGTVSRGGHCNLLARMTAFLATSTTTSPFPKACKAVFSSRFEGRHRALCPRSLGSSDPSTTAGARAVEVLRSRETTASGPSRATSSPSPQSTLDRANR
jgi:hypothetical protein